MYKASGSLCIRLVVAYVQSYKASSSLCIRLVVAYVQD